MSKFEISKTKFRYQSKDKTIDIINDLNNYETYLNIQDRQKNYNFTFHNETIDKLYNILKEIKNE